MERDLAQVRAELEDKRWTVLAEGGRSSLYRSGDGTQIAQLSSRDELVDQASALRWLKRTLSVKTPGELRIIDNGDKSALLMDSVDHVSGSELRAMSQSGGRFGWLNNVSSAIFRSPEGSEFALAGMVTPRKSFSAVE